MLIITALEGILTDNRKRLLYLEDEGIDKYHFHTLEDTPNKVGITLLKNLQEEEENSRTVIICYRPILVTWGNKTRNLKDKTRDQLDAFGIQYDSVRINSKSKITKEERWFRTIEHNLEKVPKSTKMAIIADNEAIARNIKNRYPESIVYLGNYEDYYEIT